MFFVTKPKISIIIPVYNAEKYISRCLDSVITQDYTNLEIICINDGSKDKSLDILQDYASRDSRIRVISQSNQGAASARNHGLDVATGKYISFIDADDYIKQGLYSYFAERIKDGDIDVFMFNASICYSYPEFRKECDFYCDKHFNHKIMPDEIIDYHSMQAIFYGNYSVYNKILSKQFLDENRIRFIKGNYFEDIPVHFAIICFAKKMKITYDSYYYYMQDNPSSVTNNLSSHVFEIFEIFNALDEIAERANLKQFYSYALFQFKFERTHKLILEAPIDVKETFYNRGRKYLQNCVSELNSKIYRSLINFNMAETIINNNFDEFMNKTKCSTPHISYKVCFNQNTPSTSYQCSPKISIIIPVYNAEKYISRCLDSVITQDYTNLEIICINDGSKDKSLDILQDYASRDSRIRVISQSNQGAASARNHGLDVATGKYISFIDADDYIKQGLYSYFAERIKDGDIDVFMFNASICYTDKNVTVDNDFYCDKNFNHKIMPDEIIDYRSMQAVFYAPGSVCNKIVRKKFLDENNIRFINGNYIEDVPVYFAIICFAKKMKITYDSYYYYMKENISSVTNNLSSHVFEIFEIFNALDEIAERANLKLFYSYALFQFKFEYINDFIHKSPIDIKETFYNRGRKYLQNCASELNPKIYRSLMNFNIAETIMNKSFDEFMNKTKYSTPHISYKVCFNQNTFILPVTSNNHDKNSKFLLQKQAN